MSSRHRRKKAKKTCFKVPTWNPLESAIEGGGQGTGKDEHKPLPSQAADWMIKYAHRKEKTTFVDLGAGNGTLLMYMRRHRLGELQRFIGYEIDGDLSEEFYLLRRHNGFEQTDFEFFHANMMDFQQHVGVMKNTIFFMNDFWWANNRILMSIFEPLYDSILQSDPSNTLITTANHIVHYTNDEGSVRSKKFQVIGLAPHNNNNPYARKFKRSLPKMFPGNSGVDRQFVSGQQKTKSGRKRFRESFSTYLYKYNCGGRIVTLAKPDPPPPAGSNEPWFSCAIL